MFFAYLFLLFSFPFFVWAFAPFFSYTFHFTRVYLFTIFTTVFYCFYNFLPFFLFSFFQWLLFIYLFYYYYLFFAIDFDTSKGLLTQGAPSRVNLPAPTW